MIIVTHKKPHLDEVTASWLLKTFDPRFKDCTFEFVSYTPTGGIVPTGDQYEAIGVGRGKYDEHGMKPGHTACQLVYEDLMHRGLIPNDLHEDKALEWLVQYTNKEDLGQWDNTDPQHMSFSIPAILRGLWMVHQSDQEEITEGHKIIDALMMQLNERAKFLADWDQRIEFDSIWGKAVAVHSTYRSADTFAYHHGFVLRVQTDPTKPFGDFRAPGNSKIDLTPIYEKLEKMEPGSWYLHQSKRILSSNIDPSTGLTPSKLNLQQLIDLVKK